MQPTSPRAPTPRPRTCRRSASGFTLIELLFVVTLILTLSFLAFPSLKTFSARDRDASMATFISHEFNRVKAQAQMRNRPYVVRFADFNGGQPRGLFEIYESNNTSCVDAFTDLANNARRLANYGFGATPQAGQAFTQPPGGSDPIIGLTGWVPVGGNMAAPERNQALALCVRPDGSVHTLAAGVSTPLAGRVSLLVQRFSPGSNAARDGVAAAAGAPEGPARIVRFDFAQPSRLELN